MAHAAVFVLWGCLVFAALSGPLFARFSTTAEVAVRFLIAVDGALYFCVFAFGLAGLPLLLVVAAAIWLNLGVPWWLTERVPRTPRAHRRT